MGDFEDFVTGCATDCVEAREVGCHVRPEPVEALPRRRWGLIEHYATIKAWQRLGERRVSFEDVRLAVETYLNSVDEYQAKAQKERA